MNHSANHSMEDAVKQLQEAFSELSSAVKDVWSRIKEILASIHEHRYSHKIQSYPPTNIKHLHHQTYRRRPFIVARTTC